MDRFVQVALKVNHLDGIFTYRLPEGLACALVVGKRVKVNFRNRPLMGLALAESSVTEYDPTKIKDIIEVIDKAPIITNFQLELLRFCAYYYFNPLGLCIHLALPRNEKPPKAFIKTAQKTKSYTLSDSQKQIADQIINDPLKAYLLQGITGSGKTHIYINVAEVVLAQNKSVLFIVPEISLTPQLVDRVEAALGIKALVMHSNITPSKKRDAINALIKGEAKVLIGARSAIFAPMPNLGLIVVDEEHDASFKQDESPRYHARDLALWRAKNEQASIILGSATPSLESLVNVQKGKLVHLKLDQRFLANRPLPEVFIIDLKERERNVEQRTKDQSISSGQKMCILSKVLLDEMHKTLLEGAQVLLFLNQRGYAKFGVCYDCGKMVECPDCSVGLTYYQQRRALNCHLCDYTELAQTICRNCKRDAIKFLGLGTERLEEEVRAKFSDKVIVRLDRDVVKSQRRLEDTLTAMHEQKADIMIGTQMLAKGHDFLHVSLVGVICADVALSMPDFRASEKAFQLLTQVAGRAGRGHFLGKAFIQTFNPDHPSIVFAKEHNVEAFCSQEIQLRKRFAQPPFSRMVLLRIEHQDKTMAEDLLHKATEFLRHHTNGLTLLGPTPSPVERIKQRYRFQCLLMAKEYSMLHRALKKLLEDKTIDGLIKKSRARFIIDVDPQNLS